MAVCDSAQIATNTASSLISTPCLAGGTGTKCRCSQAKDDYSTKTTGLPVFRESSGFGSRRAANSQDRHRWFCEDHQRAPIRRLTSRARAEVRAEPPDSRPRVEAMTCPAWTSLGTVITPQTVERIEMKASILSFRAAVLLVIAGMIWGIVMGISQDHSTMPAHAHLNLLGWVSLFLFGIYYHLHPAVDRSRLAVLQVWVWIAGTIVMTIGVGLVHSGHEIGDPIAAVSSLLVLADMLLFGWLVFRREPTELVSQRSAVPAE
jgi:hypothetical protein